MQTNSKAKKIKQLISQLEKDAKKLPLATKAADIVPPEGNPDAEIMFIGEAAGYHEHLQRRPFVGRAGKLLTSLLEENGIKREDVWISNVLKVRPPQNRDPQAEEIEAYKPYLDGEIKILSPKVIVTLGRFSMAKFLPTAYISQVHGQARWVNWENKRLLIFPMYHPAAALRNGSIMEKAKEDFSKLTQLIDTLNNQNESGETEIQTEEEKEENKQMKLL